MFSDFWPIGAATCLGVLVLLVVAGILTGIQAKRRTALIEELRRHGLRVTATVARIHARADRRSSEPVFTITATVTDPVTGQLRTYTDQRRQTDVPRLCVGDAVVIWVDPTQPDRYVFTDNMLEGTTASEPHEHTTFKQ